MGAIVRRPEVCRSGFKPDRADVAQLVEHSLGKGEVTGSSPVISSRSLRGSSQFVVLSFRRNCESGCELRTVNCELFLRE